MKLVFQSEVIERQCTGAVATAERKLEAAEERQARGQHRAETAADPEVVKEAVDAGALRKLAHTIYSDL